MLAISPPATAADPPWQFDPPVAVSRPAGSGVFHHLESSGRRNIAVGGDAVAVVWEDNHSGRPAVYLSRKTSGSAGFSAPEVVSTGEDEAYEPTVIALEGTRFAVGWEERENVWLRSAGQEGMGLAGKLGRGKSAQISLTAGRTNQVFACWSEQDRGRGRIRSALVRITEAGVPVVRQRAWIERIAPAGQQQFPALAYSPGRRQYTLAWEDRRRGHTVLLAAQGGAPDMFSFPRRVNELPPKDPEVKFGKGSGLARPALASFGENGIAAVWADKRNFVMGYDIYAALDAGRGFGKNRLVQDGFAEQVEQWRPTVAGSASGLLAAAFDDNREGNSDVWLAWLDGEKWSDNLAVPGASGSGEQSHASLVLDTENNLHLAFIERERPDGATAVKYVFGKYRGAVP
jgi:hypothetical protein